MSEPAPRIFRSKVDPLLTILVWAPVVAVPFVPHLLLAYLFIAWIWFSTRYEFAEERLIIRSGPLRWKVDYRAVESVRRSRNPLASPALSLDRLLIRSATGGSVLVSPARREEFLEALRQRCPQARFDV